jgi:hypothetical protein
MKSTRTILLSSILATLIISCTKNRDTPSSSTPATELQLLADSVYLFSKEIYFYNEIRTSSYDYDKFNPRALVTSDAVETAKAVIEKVRNTNANDKDKQFSYATAYDETSGSSNAVQSISDYGFFFKAGYTNRQIQPKLYADDPYFAGFYITYVYANSDAGLKGVQRGWKIISINGTDMTKISQTGVDVLNTMFYYGTLKNATIVFQKPDGQNVTLNVGITSFVPNSVLYRTKIVSATGRNIGYLVYNFFGQYSDTKADIDEAIQYFKNQGVNEIVIDLRYNRGGYTQTQNYLVNNFAPASANGGVMYKMYYNDNLQNGNYTLMRTRHAYSQGYYSVANNSYNFSTINNFNTTKLYVIVSNSTASSSELFINNLVPYYNSNIILIGDQNTYGKPVGFFPIDLFKKVTFWTVSFETKNKNEAAVAYSGFGPNFRIYDGVDKSWGDTSEECLRAAINLIDGKPVTAAAAATVPRNVTPIILKQKEIFEHSNMLFR